MIINSNTAISISPIENVCDDASTVCDVRCIMFCRVATPSRLIYNVTNAPALVFYLQSHAIIR